MQQRTGSAFAEALVGGALALGDRWHERIAVDLAVGVVQGHADLDAAVLEDHHVVDVLARPELQVAVAPHPHQILRAPRRERGQRALMLVGIDDHLRRSERRLKSGEAIVENRDLEGGKRDLGRGCARAGGTQRAVVGRRQERAVLTVDRVVHLLAAQLVEAQLAHASPSPACV